MRISLTSYFTLSFFLDNGLDNVENLIFYSIFFKLVMGSLCLSFIRHLITFLSRFVDVPSTSVPQIHV